MENPALGPGLLVNCILKALLASISLIPIQGLEKAVLRAFCHPYCLCPISNRMWLSLASN